MKKKLVVINGVLLIAIGSSAIRFYTGWVSFPISHNPATIQSEGDLFPSPLVPEVGNEEAASDWTRIWAQNLFSFDRNDVAIAPPEARATAGPRPILFGTMSLGEGPVALLATGQTRNRNSRPYGIGESIDGWEVVEIRDKSIVIGSGGIRTTVLMNDPTAGVPRDTRRTLSPSGGAPQVSTVQAAPQVQSSSTPSSSRTPSPAPAGVGADGPVPPGFMIQRTPFGNRIIPIPEQ